MIRYALNCADGHGFEGWFGSSADYDGQEARGLLQCPLCGSAKIAKQIMAPSVAGTKSQARGHSVGELMMDAMGKLRAHVEATFEDVGEGFAAEARAIHEGKAQDREIFGQATSKEVVELLRDGVLVAPMPPKAPAKNEIN